MNRLVIKALMKWLQIQVDNLPFGEVTVRVTLRDGKIALVRRISSEQKKPGDLLRDADPAN